MTARFASCRHFNYHNCPEYAQHKRAFNLLLSMKNNKRASICFLFSVDAELWPNSREGVIRCEKAASGAR
jgi:hypothetical protein